MAENEFAMVSDWMPNGNINQFVSVHQDANRFELVSPPLEPLRLSSILDAASIVDRRCEGIGLYA